MLRNDTKHPFQLRVWVEEEHLCGEIRSTAVPECRYTVFEKEACIRQMSWGGYVRHNELWRKTEYPGGIREEKLFTNDAIMMYSPLLPQ